ncbi:MAG: hypothetical protein HQK52_13605 [Oligoflexia bacterium]|nr:hypothetical protein [Oligoflexia bacterium]
MNPIERFKAHWKETKKNVSHKIFPCPSCRQQLRVPVRFGKKLLVHCPKCRAQVQVQFPHPLAQLKQALITPQGIKRVVITLVIIIVLITWVTWYRNIGV